jgi:hypothetical protein
VQWGAWFLIIEPKWTGRGIGQDCVTIFELSQDHAIIPVEAKVDQIQKNIPIVPLEESSLRCFGYHCSVKIKLTAINFFRVAVLEFFEIEQKMQETVFVLPKVDCQVSILSVNFSFLLILMQLTQDLVSGFRFLNIDPLGSSKCLLIPI